MRQPKAFVQNESDAFNKKSAAMFRNAIVRVPCPSIINGLTSALLGKPDYRKAMKQHSAYVDSTQKTGLEC